MSALKPRDIWLLRIFAVLAWLGAAQILFLGKVGAPIGTDSYYVFKGWLRLFFIWPALIGAFFWWVTTPDKDGNNEGEE